MTEWAALRNAGYWTDVVAVHSRATPPQTRGQAVEELVVVADRADLHAALEALAASWHARVVEVDRSACVDALEILAHRKALLTRPLRKTRQRRIRSLCRAVHPGASR